MVTILSLSNFTHAISLTHTLFTIILLIRVDKIGRYFANSGDSAVYSLVMNDQIGKVVTMTVTTIEHTIIHCQRRLLQRRGLSQRLRNFKIKLQAQIYFSKRNTIFPLRMEIIAEESNSHIT